MNVAMFFCFLLFGCTRASFCDVGWYHQKIKKKSDCIFCPDGFVGKPEENENLRFLAQAGTKSGKGTEKGHQIRQKKTYG